MTSKDDPPSNTCRSIVTQMYTFSSLSKPKAVANSQACSSMLPYVGFPGLSLTPIPENPLLDPSIGEDSLTPSEKDRWLAHDDVDHHPLKKGAGQNGRSQMNGAAIQNGSLPKHWLTNGGSFEGLSISEETGAEDSEGGAGRSKSQTAPPCASAVNVQVVQTTTFLPKEEGEEGAMTREEKRAHLCKLLLFALCGFIIVAAIVLWIFSPAFT